MTFSSLIGVTVIIIAYIIQTFVIMNYDKKLDYYRRIQGRTPSTENCKVIDSKSDNRVTSKVHACDNMEHHDIEEIEENPWKAEIKFFPTDHDRKHITIDGWIYNNGDVYESIHFCPYCGIKLANLRC